MPGPDPRALWIEEGTDRPTVTFQAYLCTGNNGNRRKRAVTMLRRLMHGNWACGWCGDPLPDWRRADARYCREGCRKKAARRRRCVRQARNSPTS